MQDNRTLVSNLLRAARSAPRNVEIPQLPQPQDIQMHLARVDAPQPFFVIRADDSVLNQLSGTGTIQFQLSNVRWHRLAPGDIVYIPAGTPHRYLPAEESVHLTYQAARPDAEAVAWFCPRCDTELHRYTFDPNETSVESAHRAGLAGFTALAAFDTQHGSTQDDQHRPCPGPHAVHGRQRILADTTG